MFCLMVKCLIGVPKLLFLFLELFLILESHLEIWVRGDYYISGATISRFFALACSSIYL